MKGPALTADMLDTLLLNTFPDAKVTRVENDSHPYTRPPGPLRT